MPQLNAEYVRIVKKKLIIEYFNNFFDILKTKKQHKKLEDNLSDEDKNEKTKKLSN